MNSNLIDATSCPKDAGFVGNLCFRSLNYFHATGFSEDSSNVVR